MGEGLKRAAAAAKANRRGETRRWHFKTGGPNEILICVGDHAKDEPCEFHIYRYAGKAPTV